MREARRIQRTLARAVAAVLAASFLWVASASADSMVVQPDGKIVLLGRVWPEAGAIARLMPDGSPDPSFGDRGFVIDHRLPGFRALALQSDGRIVGAAVGGFQLARYLPDGAADPEFAGGGVGGTDEADQPHFLYSSYGPSAVVLQPGGGIVVAGTRQANGGGATEGWVKRYDVSGRFLETAGHIELPNGPASASGISDLLEEGDGSLVGVGRFYPGSPEETQPFLAGFVPGSGNDYDPSFGGAVGLARPTFLLRERLSTQANALALSGGKLLLAGRTGATLLLARFSQDGFLDASFGEHGGFSAPPIAGPGDAASKGAAEEANTWANDLAVEGDGKTILGGGTSQWGKWSASKAGINCSECPQPMLARFDAGGHLDLSFGQGGLLRLSKPDGSIFTGEVEQVVALAGGKILVKGRVPSYGVEYAPFVARLNPDGSYDASFGEGGLMVLRFPCSDQSVAQKRRSGCVPSARVTLHLTGLRHRHPALHLRVRPSLSWGAVHAVTFTLPRGLRLTHGYRSKLRVVGAEEGAEIHVIPAKRGHGKTSLLLQELGDATQLWVGLQRGGLNVLGHAFQQRKLTFGVWAEFSDARWGNWAGYDSVTRRAG